MKAEYVKKASKIYPTTFAKSPGEVVLVRDSPSLMSIPIPYPESTDSSTTSEPPNVKDKDRSGISHDPKPQPPFQSLLIADKTLDRPQPFLINQDQPSSPFPYVASSLAASLRPDLVEAYFKKQKNNLFFFSNPSTDPSKCVGVRVGGEKCLTARPLLDYGSNCFIIIDSEARRLGIPILPFNLSLNTSNGVSSIQGVTPPVTISYGAPPSELTSEHCMLVISAHSNTCFTILFGNPDAITFDAIHDVTANLLYMRPKGLSQDQGLALPITTKRS